MHVAGFSGRLWECSVVGAMDGSGHLLEIREHRAALGRHTAFEGVAVWEMLEAV